MATGCVEARCADCRNVVLTRDQVERIVAELRVMYTAVVGAREVIIDSGRNSHLLDIGQGLDQQWMRFYDTMEPIRLQA